MSTGLLQQLADYGAFHDEEQGYVDVDDAFAAGNAVVPSGAPLYVVPRRSTRIGVSVAMAVAVLTILSISVIPLWINNQDAPPAGTIVPTAPVDDDAAAAPPYATAEDAAAATVKAINLGNWDAYRAAFADDATDGLVSINRAISDHEEVHEARFALLVAAGVSSNIESCTTLLGDSATCRTTDSDVILDALGAEPIVSESVFDIEDGLLVYVSRSRNQIETPEIVGAFFEWAEETNNPAPTAWNDYWVEPIGKDPSITIAVILKAVDEFLSQYQG